MRRFRAGASVYDICIELHGKFWADQDTDKLRKTNVALYNKFMICGDQFEEDCQNRSVAVVQKPENMAQNKDGSFGLQKTSSLLDAGIKTERVLGRVWEPWVYWMWFTKAPATDLSEWEVTPGRICKFRLLNNDVQQ